MAFIIIPLYNFFIYKSGLYITLLVHKGKNHTVAGESA